MKLWKQLLCGALAVVGFSSTDAQALWLKNPFQDKQTHKQKKNLAPEAVPGEFVVKMRLTGMSTLSESAKTLAKLGLQVQQTINAREGLVLVKSNQSQLMTLGSQSHEKLMSQVASLSQVEFIEPNFIYRIMELPASLPNDTDFARLWGLRNEGQNDSRGRAGVVGADIKAPEAWTLSKGSRDIVVAVIDTGVDYNHPDLKENIWENPNHPGTYGFNAINNTLNPMDDNAHGTHCAGTIAGVGDNGVGVVGVAWEASIMGVKFLSGSGSGTLADAIKAIDWATDNGAHIMSNSWGGGGFSQALFDAIVRARDKGILFVAAAGNSSSDNDARPAYPASYDVDNIVSVASSNNIDALSGFSSFGANSVHLMAPGENIYSTVPVSTRNAASPYDTFSGTSMATPHVSGAAVLLLAKEPSVTYGDIKERLMTSTDKSRAFRGKIRSMGRLNVYNLLAGIAGPGPIIPPDSSWSAPIARNIETAHPYLPNQNLSWTIEHPGARYLRVHFSRFDLESGYDFLRFKAADGSVLESLSGRRNGAFSTNELEGDKITLEFTSDESVQSWGFQITGYSWTDFNGQTHNVQVNAR
jgi:thermitase